MVLIYGRIRWRRKRTWVSCPRKLPCIWTSRWTSTWRIVRNYIWLIRLVSKRPWMRRRSVVGLLISVNGCCVIFPVVTSNGWELLKRSCITRSLLCWTNRLTGWTQIKLWKCVIWLRRSQKNVPCCCLLIFFRKYRPRVGRSRWSRTGRWFFRGQ